MNVSMTHALDILKTEKRQLQECLSNWDCEQYPEAKEKRDRKLRSVEKAITCLTLVNDGINPLTNGDSEEKKDNYLWCKSPNNFLL
jgi:predicted transcriptional regulator